MSEECECGAAPVLVYSCSGGSNVGQMANEIARSLGKIQNVKMSCLAGIGGDISSFTESAKAAKGTVAIDGCRIAYGEGAPELPRSAGWGVLAGDQIMWGTLSSGGGRSGGVPS